MSALLLALLAPTANAESVLEFKTRSPVAVFVDGHAYHASTDHNRIADDARKRAILRSGGVLVWSFGYEDLHRFTGQVEQHPVHPGAAGCVGVIADEDVAARFDRSAAPGERRGDVISFAGEAYRDLLAVGKGGRCELNLRGAGFRVRHLPLARFDPEAHGHHNDEHREHPLEHDCRDRMSDLCPDPGAEEETKCDQ